MIAKIRLAVANVRPVHTWVDKDNCTWYRFGEIGNARVFEIRQRNILNYEEIDMMQDFFRIVTAERVSFGLFSGITCTRQIELPK